jgi:hypothetical protein
MSQCAITGKQSFYITRALLGILEVGFMIKPNLNQILIIPGWLHSGYSTMAFIFLYRTRTSNQAKVI